MEYVDFKIFHLRIPEFYLVNNKWSFFKKRRNLKGQLRHMGDHFPQVRSGEQVRKGKVVSRVDIYAGVGILLIFLFPTCCLVNTLVQGFGIFIKLSSGSNCDCKK